MTSEEKKNARREIENLIFEEFSGEQLVVKSQGILLTGVNADVQDLLSLPASTVVGELEARCPNELMDLILYMYFMSHPRISKYDAQSIQRQCEEAFGESCSARLARILHLGAACRSGSPQATLLDILDLQRPTTDRWTALLQALANLTQGYALQLMGDFRRAHDHFGEALRISEDADLQPMRVRVLQRTAALYWASGQPNHGYQTYEELQQHPGYPRLGVDSRLSLHLSAAKCAIDFKDPELASKQLQVALNLLPETQREDLDAYATLFTGELAVLKEDYDGGKRLLFGAADRFEKLDPPHYAGVLEAKISLSHFAFYEGNRALAIVILQKLLQEAEERQCFTARSRLLVLQTLFFVSDTPPLRDAFDHIITRLHLINNPALLMQALGNLYTYSLEFLEDRDSAFMLQRIRNLESVLEKSCFDNLYRSYISERYEYAIENRLARLAEAEGDGHDFEGESETDPEELRGP